MFHSSKVKSVICSHFRDSRDLFVGASGHVSHALPEPEVPDHDSSRVQPYCGPAVARRSCSLMVRHPASRAFLAEVRIR